MNSESDHPELVLRPSGLSRFWLVILYSTLISYGVFLVLRENAWGWLCIIFFGLGTVYTIYGITSKADCLRLTAEGFTYTKYIRPRTIPWKHVTRFGLARGHDGDVVAWNFVESHRLSGMELRMTNESTGFDAMLGDNFGRTPRELLSLMEDWWLAHGDALPPLLNDLEDE